MTRDTKTEVHLVTDESATRLERQVAGWIDSMKSRQTHKPDGQPILDVQFTVSPYYLEYYLETEGYWMFRYSALIVSEVSI